MILYEIRNTVNDSVYVGITRSKLDQRWRSHKHSSKSVMTPLYCMMRKYGFDKFYITQISVFQKEIELLEAEKHLISQYRQSSIRCLNILDGGESYFPIYDMEAHKRNLCEKRKGRKPALGMKHTEENKKLFSMYGKKRWDKYGRYPQEVINYSFKEANLKYKISKTHYYRIKNLAKSNEFS